MTPREEILQWIRANRGAPHAGLAQRIADSPDMEMAWPALTKAGAKPIHVFSMIWMSLNESEQDMRRLSRKAEQSSIRAVDDAAKRLLVALQGAQFLNEGAPILEIGEATCAVAWTDYRAKILERLPTGLDVDISLPDLLRTLRQECERHIKAAPVRAIGRERDGPERTQIRAFARRMAARLARQFGAEMPETISLISCAVFQPEKPVTGRDKLLDGSPFRG
jgi:hypothetical protein